jgi:hypothetical protein
MVGFVAQLMIELYAHTRKGETSLRQIDENTPRNEQYGDKALNLFGLIPRRLRHKSTAVSHKSHKLGRTRYLFLSVLICGGNKNLLIPRG